jgi:hypothetical protein
MYEVKRRKPRTSSTPVHTSALSANISIPTFSLTCFPALRAGRWAESLHPEHAHHRNKVGEGPAPTGL